MTPAPSENIRLGMEAEMRKGLVSHGLAWAGQRAGQRREDVRRAQVWEKASEAAAAEDGGQGEVAGTPQMTPLQQEAGGREHVGGVNERLDDIQAREQTSTFMGRTIRNVLTTSTGGRMKLPAYRFGSSRTRKGS